MATIATRLGKRWCSIIATTGREGKRRWTPASM
jgi:hypothetical protein